MTIISNRLRLLFSELLNKRFYGGLDVVSQRANRLYREKGTTVVCVYCGKLLLKSEAAFVYDIEAGSGEYSHEDCFNANESHPAEIAGWSPPAQRTDV